MSTKSKLGLVLAIGAASAFALTPAVSTAAHHHHHGSMMKCFGVNACKGKSSCKSANNACKGQNTCKEKGFVAMSAKQCDQVGGTTRQED